MKRGREDGASSLAAEKRPSSARPVSGQSAQTKPTTNDALSYLKEVKSRFSANKDVYDNFLEIMKEFKAQRIDTTGVIQHVKQLFKGHRELVLGFNTFLPKGYEIELARISDDEEEEVVEKQPVEFDQAINYVNTIKIRFSSDDRVYKAFLEILNMYRKGHKNIHNVYEEVAVLFASHQDLLDAFTYFLPDNSQPQPHSLSQPQPRLPRPGLGGNRASAGRGGPAAVGAAVGGAAVWRASAAGVGAAAGGPAATAVGGATAATAGGAGGPAAAAAMLQSHTEPGGVHKRKAARKAEEGFKAGYGTGSFDRDDVPAARPALAKELQFFDRIKQRLRNKDAYTDVLKCLNLYSQEIVSRQELMYLVSDIIGKFPDLVNGFLEFVGKVEMMDSELLGGAKLNNQMVMQREMIRQKQLLKDKFMTKPLSEIVATEQERVTPSYVRIPAGFPKLSTSGRTELGHSILNDSFVNVITGSEDYSFKLMRKNQYEEALFRCEDDRYEFDMCIETNHAALKLHGPIVELSAKMSPDERNYYQLEAGHLLYGPVPAFAIERLYAESGAHVVELLRKYPAVVAPIVAARMEAKDAEWRKIREDMTKTWRKIYALNYHKSLDHRSFYFKQAEKKSLLPKAILSEIREISEARKAVQPKASQDASLRALLNQSRRFQPPSADVPDLKYNYSDKVVFDDCWSVVRTAILESSGIGSKQEVAKLYLQTVEPFFGLPVRQQELDNMKAEVEEKRAARGGAAAREESGNESSEREHNDARRPESTPEPGGYPYMDVDADDTLRKSARGKGSLKREQSASTSSEGEGDASSADEQKTNEFDSCRPVSPYFIDPSVPSVPMNSYCVAPSAPSAPPGTTAGGATSGGVTGVDAGSATAGGGSAASDDAAGRSTGGGSMGGGATSGGASGTAAADAGDASGTATGYNATGGAKVTSTCLLLANEFLFVFFGFHRHLYDRLRTARRCSLQQAQQQRAGQQFRQIPVPSAGGCSKTPEELAAEVQLKEDAERIHSAFMSMTQQVLKGEIETLLYEDQVRALLGTSSYELFTIDKLLSKLIVHMRSLLQDEQSAKLVELHRYEQARGQAAASRAVYFVNSHTLIDDTVFQIKHCRNSGELTIQMLESERGDGPAPSGAGPHSGEGPITQYLSNFVAEPAEPLTAAGRRVYLQGNLTRRERESPDEAMMDALKCVRLYNGLECKVACVSNKVSYVVDTQDWLCHSGRMKRGSEARRVLRSEKFQEWLDETADRSKAEEEAVLALTGPVAIAVE